MLWPLVLSGAGFGGRGDQVPRLCRAQGRKQLRLEYFDREMRRKFGLLMQGDKPEGGSRVVS